MPDVNKQTSNYRNDEVITCAVALSTMCFDDEVCGISLILTDVLFAFPHLTVLYVLPARKFAVCLSKQITTPTPPVNNEGEALLSQVAFCTMLVSRNAKICALS